MNAYASINPATGEIADQNDIITDSELHSVLALASHSRGEWSRSSATERAALLHRIADLHDDFRQRLATVIVEEMGKPLEQAVSEVDFSAEIYRYYANHAVVLNADEPIILPNHSQGSAFIRRSPFGTILGIMPWNFPLYQVARFAAPNVAMGNTVIVKHAPQCPRTAALIESIFRVAAAPEGLYLNVFASNHQIAQLIADSRIHGVSLTGSERAGSAVAELAGRHLKKVVLELGGSDPFLLFSTENMPAVVTAAVSARLDNNGQTCNAPKRFIVIDPLFDEFAEKFTEAMLAVSPADPMQKSTALGPVASVAAAEQLQGQVEAARRQGATVRAMDVRNGNFFPPVVITDITPEMNAYHEEFFGPVAQLYRVATEADAVHLANDTPFGLGAYVFTTDRNQALRVTDQLDVGMVWVNLAQGDSPELPFGGVKKSGFGRELGKLGAEEFVNKKLVRLAEEI